MSMKSPEQWELLAGTQDFEMLHPTERRNVYLQEFIAMVQQDAIDAHSRSAKVAEFHGLVGQPVLATPRAPANKRVRLRLKLHLEEAVKECFEACLDLHETTAAPSHRDVFLRAIGDLMWIAAVAPVRVDLSGAAKEFADAAYVVEGSFLEFGIDGNEVFDEVHRSNLTKEGSDMRADGKITKGPNYQPPDIAGVLKRQGWNGSNEGETK
jgi:predicted HAD superfamily Cof-like phosphohydrolase